MNVSSNFNRLYHGLFLAEIYKQMLSQKKIDINFETFKGMLKYLNPDYPKYDGTDEAVSTKDIKSADLVQHIEFIIAWSGGYGITPSIIQEEFDRMMTLIRD